MKKTFCFLLTLLLVAVLGTAAACSVKKYEIRFTDGETTVETIRTADNESLTLPAPLSENHACETFRGWFFDKGTWTLELTEDYYRNSDLTADVTVYACWIKNAPTPRFQASA